MRILGLDPSLTGFGWTIHRTSDDPKDFTGVLEDRGTFKTTKRTPMPWRYLSHQESLKALLVRAHEDGGVIDFVGIEHPPFKGSYSAGLYALYMDIWHILLDWRLPFVCYLPPQLKAYARRVLDETGKMSKQDMKDLFCMLYGNPGRFNNNEADAGVCGFMAGRFAQLLRGEITEDDLLDYEKDMYHGKTGHLRNEGENTKGKYFDYPDSKYDVIYATEEE